MRRALLVGAGTLAGIAALLTLDPEAPSTAAAASASATAAASGTATSDPSTSDTTSSAGTSTGSTSSSSTSSTSSTSGTASASGATDGTYTGDVVDVGHGYGTVQLEVTVSGGKVVDITALAVPSDDPRSAQISAQAVPMLVQQAISAQSAGIAGVSGATYTSTGFAESLRSALVQAGLAS